MKKDENLNDPHNPKLKFRKEDFVPIPDMVDIPDEQHEQPMRPAELAAPDVETVQYNRTAPVVRVPSSPPAAIERRRPSQQYSQPPPAVDPRAKPPPAQLVARPPPASPPVSAKQKQEAIQQLWGRTESTGRPEVLTARVRAPVYGHVSPPAQGVLVSHARTRTDGSSQPLPGTRQAVPVTTVRSNELADLTPPKAATPTKLAAYEPEEEEDLVDEPVALADIEPLQQPPLVYRSPGIVVERKMVNSQPLVAPPSAESLSRLMPAAGKPATDAPLIELPKTPLPPDPYAEGLPPLPGEKGSTTTAQATPTLDPDAKPALDPDAKPQVAQAQPSIDPDAKPALDPDAKPALDPDAAPQVAQTPPAADPDTAPQVAQTPPAADPDTAPQVAQTPSAADSDTAPQVAQTPPATDPDATPQVAQVEKPADTQPSEQAQADEEKKQRRMARAKARQKARRDRQLAKAEAEKAKNLEKKQLAENTPPREQDEQQAQDETPKPAEETHIAETKQAEQPKKSAPAAQATATAAPEKPASSLAALATQKATQKERVASPLPTTTVVMRTGSDGITRAYHVPQTEPNPVPLPGGYETAHADQYGTNREPIDPSLTPILSHPSLPPVDYSNVIENPYRTRLEAQPFAQGRPPQPHEMASQPAASDIYATAPQQPDMSGNQVASTLPASETQPSGMQYVPGEQPQPLAAPQDYAAAPVQPDNSLVQPLPSAQPEQKISQASQDIIDSLPPLGVPEKSHAASEQLAIIRGQSILAARDGLGTETIDHESTGVKIKVETPRINMDYELEKAYNALVAGNADAAAQTYRLVLENDPVNKNALFGLATIYHRSGQLDMARPLYAKLLTIDPENRDGLNNFLVLLADEAPEDALMHLEQLKALNPDFSPIPAQMAVIYQKLGIYEKAIENMTYAIKVAPENMAYRYNFAVMLDQQGKREEAAKLYEQILTAHRRGVKIPGDINQVQQRLTFIRSNR